MQKVIITSAHVYVKTTFSSMSIVGVDVSVGAGVTVFFACVVYPEESMLHGSANSRRACRQIGAGVLDSADIHILHPTMRRTKCM